MTHADILVRTRSALLDALEALAAHRRAVIVIGAQAVYLHTGDVRSAVAEMTKDSDLVIDPRHLDDDPRVEAAMRRAGFLPAVSSQPGAWVNAESIPVDLMVPEAVAGSGGRNARGARVPPHDRRAMRRAVGLEAALIDRVVMTVNSLDPTDARSAQVQVAGPAALLVAKLHKIGERTGTPHRLRNKDAHDVYRILQATSVDDLVTSIRRLLLDPLCGDVTTVALGYLERLFAEGPLALGSAMAGQAEEGVGDSDGVALAVSILAEDVMLEINSGGSAGS